MLRIEIKSPEVRTISGTCKPGTVNAGKPYCIRDQEAYAWLVGRDGKPRDYPERISVQLDDDQEAYRPGVYTLAPQSLYVGDFGRLQMGKPKLMPVAAAAAKAA
jgi:hypothetical protein